MNETTPEPDTSPSPSSIDSPSDSAMELPETRSRRQVDEWALVLRAEGFSLNVVRHARRFQIELPAADLPRAHSILDAWKRERAERENRVVPPAPRPARPIETATAYALALTLLAFHLGLEFVGRREALIEIGSSQTDQVLAGHVERLVTALTLHSDLPHVLGNTLFGGFFLAALAPRLGIGVALLAFVVTGALGNFANAVYYGVAHNSVGASTGVFGLVGVLAGLAAWHRQQTARPGRGAWVALAAGLGILAMLGTGGPRVDVTAHLFGLLAGALTGGLIAVPLAARPPPRTAVQVAAFTLSVALVFAAWRIAAHA